MLSPNFFFSLLSFTYLPPFSSLSLRVCIRLCILSCSDTRPWSVLDGDYLIFKDNRETEFIELSSVAHKKESGSSDSVTPSSLHKNAKTAYLPEKACSIVMRELSILFCCFAVVNT